MKFPKFTCRCYVEDFKAYVGIPRNLMYLLKAAYYRVFIGNLLNIYNWKYKGIDTFSAF